MSDFYQEIIEELKTTSFSSTQWTKYKRELAAKHKLDTIPTNIEIFIHTTEQDIPLIKHKLLSKPVRTISGVSPVAIMTSPANCPHGKCTFCPGGINSPWGDVPQSYTGHEPATMRGMRNNYDSYLQVFNRLQQYVLMGHSFDKIEIIVMGGTFTARPLTYQNEFIYGTFKALNDFSDLFFNQENNFNYEKFKTFFELPGSIEDQQRTINIQQKLLQLKSKTSPTTIAQEQTKNETSHVRCVALCIETKPDWGFLEHGNRMLDQGCTRVELGIESVYDDVLKITHRGHTADDSQKSIQILRDLGFKINFHYMPGLPLTDKARDLAGMNQLFTDQSYKPDMIKIYPCMVAPGTALYHQHQQGKFTPLTTDQAAELIVAWKKNVPEYCRIQRIQRDVPTKYWTAGVALTNFRQYIFQKYNPICRCIRCREPQGKNVNWDNITININEYQASNGTEFFISAEDSTNDILIGFCRLRFPSQFLRPEITTDSALIRELHVYGTATAIGDEGMVQHKGFGKKLMAKAEEIAVQHKKNKIVVISGVGVREYYKKIGYKQEGSYMVKNIS